MRTITRTVATTTTTQARRTPDHASASPPPLAHNGLNYSSSSTPLPPLDPDILVIVFAQRWPRPFSSLGGLMRSRTENYRLSLF